MVFIFWVRLKMQLSLIFSGIIFIVPYSKNKEENRNQSCLASDKKQ